VSENDAKSNPDMPAAGGEPTPAKRLVWPHVALAIVLVAAVLGEAWLWLVFEPGMGRSIQNLVTYSVGLLVFGLIVLWTAFYAPFSRRARLAGVLLLLAPVISFAATVRRAEWSGDMQLVLKHWWDPVPPPAGTAPPLPEGISLVAQPEDMPCYRGWNFAGVVEGPPLSQDWEASPPKLLWRQACGGGYSQSVVVEPFLVTMEQNGGKESVVCYDTATGGERWRHEYDAMFDEAMGGPGPRSTPTIHDGAVYTVGAVGDCCRLSLLDGKLAWRINILDEHKAAYHRDTGNLVWVAEGVQGHQAGSVSNRPGYSTPMLVDLLGVRQILMFDGTGLRGYVPETGKRLWEFEHVNGAGVNVAQPIVFDDGRVFISCSYDVGCAMVQVSRDGDAWSAKNLWKSPNLNLRCKFTSPVLYDGYLYGLDEGILVCLDPATGERKWKKGRYGHGQLLLTNGQLLVHTEDGRAVLVDPDPSRLREVTSFRTLDDAKNWNPPTLVRGKLYVRNHHEMAAFDLTGEPGEPGA
jgi:outer membrane protein assembly factor BamB